MKKTLSISGFCPTLNEETVIDIIYRQISGNRYLQTGADCEHAAFNECPNMMSCPIRATTPKETII